MPDPKAYYAWYRPTDEYLDHTRRGWTPDLALAAAFASRDAAWIALREHCRACGLDADKGCVSVGWDLID